LKSHHRRLDVPVSRAAKVTLEIQMKSIDSQRNKFRLAARGVFNQYFRTDPKDRLEDA